MDRIVETDGNAGINFGGGINDPCQTFFGKMASLFKANTVPNVSVTVTPAFMLPSKDASGSERKKKLCVVKTDSCILHEIDGSSLLPKRILKYEEINPDLNGIASAAHEEYDESTKSYFNFVVSLGMNLTFKVFEISPVYPIGKVIAEFTHPHWCYIHSFASTNKYVVIALFPFRFAWKGLKVVVTGKVSECFEWDKNFPVIYHVIDRQKHGVVARFTSETFFSFHSINSFDDGDDVVIDFCAINDPNAVLSYIDLELMRSINSPKLEEFRKSQPVKVKRVRLPSVSVESSKHSISAAIDQLPNAKVEFAIPVPLDLPRINPKMKYNPKYKFVYGIIASSDEHSHALFDSLVKIDLQTRKPIYWSKVGFTPSEPIFVPRPGAVDEDDGILLSVVLDGFKNKSYLAIIDAKTMTEVATAFTPQPIAYGFHGAFV